MSNYPFVMPDHAAQLTSNQESYMFRRGVEVLPIPSRNRMEDIVKTAQAKETTNRSHNTRLLFGDVQLIQSGVPESTPEYGILQTKAREIPSHTGSYLPKVELALARSAHEKRIAAYQLVKSIQNGDQISANYYRRELGLEEDRVSYGYAPVIPLAPYNVPLYISPGVPIGTRPTFSSQIATQASIRNNRQATGGNYRFQPPPRYGVSLPDQPNLELYRSKNAGASHNKEEIRSRQATVNSNRTASLIPEASSFVKGMTEAGVLRSDLLSTTNPPNQHFASNSNGEIPISQSNNFLASNIALNHNLSNDFQTTADMKETQEEIKQSTNKLLNDPSNQEHKWDSQGRMVFPPQTPPPNIQGHPPATSFYQGRAQSHSFPSLSSSPPPPPLPKKPSNPIYEPIPFILSPSPIPYKGTSVPKAPSLNLADYNSPVSSRTRSRYNNITTFTPEEKAILRNRPAPKNPMEELKDELVNSDYYQSLIAQANRQKAEDVDTDDSEWKEPENNTTKKSVGTGIKRIRFTPSSGRGFGDYKVDKQYGKLGQYLLHKEKLAGNKLSILRERSRFKTNEYPNQLISDSMVKLLQTCLMGDSPSKKIFQSLPHEEQWFLSRLIKRSKCTHVSLPHIDEISSSYDQSTRATQHLPLAELKQKLQICLGEIKSGNNSNLLKTQTQEILIRCVEHHLLSYELAQDYAHTFHLTPLPAKKSASHSS